MNTIVDGGIELIIVWDGAHRGTDADLFRRIEVSPEPPQRPARVTRSEACEAVAEELPRRVSWHTSDLRAAAGLTPAEFDGALRKLRRAGLVFSSRRGLVRGRLAREAA